MGLHHVHGGCGFNEAGALRPRRPARIAELQQKTARKLEITAEAVANELALLAFSNILDYVQVQDDGTAYVDLSRLTRDQAAAIQEITTEEVIEGAGDAARKVRKVRFRLASKKDALETLGKHLGMFVERRVNLNADLKDVDDDELDARIRAIEAQLAGSEAGAAAPARGAASPTRH